MNRISLNSLKAISLCLLLSVSFSDKASADFNYGHTCPTVEAALIRIAQEHKDAAVNALKTGIAAPAEVAVPIPGPYQGYWSLPNCDTPDVTTIYTKYFSYSLMFGAEACLQQVENVAEGSNFTQITVPSDNIIKQYNAEEESFEAAFTVNDDPADLSKSWAENINEESPVFKFHKCSAPNPDHYKLHAPGLKLIRYMDHAVTICNQDPNLSFANNEDCHHLLLVIADADVNFEVSAEEIKKGLLMLNYLSFINHNGAAIDNLIGSMEKAEKRAETLSHLMITVMDEDKSGGLTRTEVENNYKKLPDNSSEWYYFKKMFKSLDNIFPSFALTN
tara:strand:+ start:90350 stop:91348 length:999 start_codon:yes stop_codon:yes gene_type:complete